MTHPCVAENGIDIHSHWQEDAAIASRVTPMYVCICNGITDRDIRDAARAGASDLSDLSPMTGCSTACGRCGELATDILREARSEDFGLPLLAA